MENSRKISANGLLRPFMLLLYFLNTADLLFTKFLLNTGLFFEANPIMALAMQNFWAVFTLKLLLPALLLGYLDYRTAKSDERTAKIVFWAIAALTLVYLLVMALHIFLLNISGYFI